MSSKNKIDKGFTPPFLKKDIGLEGRAGFMLLEVMLSMLVVSVGVVFVISSFITSLKAFKLSKIYVDAVYLIEQKLWEYEEKGGIEDGRAEGRFNDKGAEWKIDAKELEDLPLEETSAEIVIKDGGRKQTFTVVTYFNKEF